MKAKGSPTTLPKILPDTAIIFYHLILTIFQAIKHSQSVMSQIALGVVHDRACQRMGQTGEYLVLKKSHMLVSYLIFNLFIILFPTDPDLCIASISIDIISYHE